MHLHRYTYNLSRYVLRMKRARGSCTTRIQVSGRSRWLSLVSKTADISKDKQTGDRLRLFTAISQYLPVRPDTARVLYPGSYVDVAPSFVFKAVTYIDVDKRAQKFFSDVEGVEELVAQNDGPLKPDISFIHGDHTEVSSPASLIELPDAGFDLLVSLYAGFISEYRTRCLKIGGSLLVNPSHGDAAMASIDPR
eukprot:jgi/Ulvmu1/419/UM001_0426.1